MDSWDDYVDDDRRRPARPGDHRPAGASADRRATASAAGSTLTREVHDRGGQLYLVGNGASAAMASHIAADACKNGGLRAQAFNDAALLTATGNDLAFDQVFALPLDRLARAGDLLIAISSSGDSPNIVRALEAARDAAAADRDAVRQGAGQSVARARRRQLLRAAARATAGSNRPIRSSCTTGSIST